MRGARAAGATEIVVMDCHGAGDAYSFNSLVPELLDPACEYVVQQEWTEYTGFLESGCDAALFVGMHAMAGTSDGVLSHTVSGQAWRNLRFNGRLVGETGINAALCGHWGCPVVLVTGDEAVCGEGRRCSGGADDGRRSSGGSAASAPGRTRRPCPRADRGRCQGGARRPVRRRPVRPGRPCEIRSSSRRPSARRSTGTATASRSPTPARSSPVATTGGRPGRASSSRGPGPAARSSPATRRRGWSRVCSVRWVSRALGSPSAFRSGRGACSRHRTRRPCLREADEESSRRPGNRRSPVAEGHVGRGDRW